MIRNKLTKFIRPIRRKMYIGSLLVLMAKLTVVTGGIGLILAAASHFLPILYVEWYMLYAWLGGMAVAVVWSIVKRPTTETALKMTDSLGYKERLVTAWQFDEEESEAVTLQREDMEATIKTSDLRGVFKVHLPYPILLRGLVLFALAIGLLFIDSPVRKEARAAEEQIETIQLEEAALKEEVDKLLDEAEAPEKLKEEMDALMKELAEKLKDAKTEEEALKALSIAKDELKKMEMEDLKNALERLKESLAGMDKKDISEMSEEEMQAKKEALEKALEALEEQKEAMGEEQLKEALEQSEALQEALEALQEAMANEDTEGASEMAAQAAELTEEALQAIQSNSDLSQAMQAAVNSAGQSLSTNPTISELAFSPSEPSDSSDSVATQGSQGQSGSQSGSQGQQAGAGQGQGQGNQGSQGSSGQGQGQGGQQGQNGGSGQGQGTTNEDAGYQDENSSGGSQWFSGEAKSGEYEALYDPNRIGGTSEPNFVQGQRSDGGESQVKQVEGAPAMTGDLISYKQLYAEYSEQAFHTVEDMQIPVLMKDLVKDYFSSLE